MMTSHRRQTRTFPVASRLLFRAVAVVVAVAAMATTGCDRMPNGHTISPTQVKVVAAEAHGVELTDEQAHSVAAHLNRPAPQPASGGNIESMIRARWAGTGQADRAVRIAKCESKLNPHAQNKRSSAYGTFQFLNATWRSTGIAKTSDPALQIEAAFRLWKQRGWQPWVCKG